MADLELYRLLVVILYSALGMSVHMDDEGYLIMPDDEDNPHRPGAARRNYHAAYICLDKRDAQRIPAELEEYLRRNRFLDFANLESAWVSRFLLIGQDNDQLQREVFGAEFSVKPEDSWRLNDLGLEPFEVRDTSFLLPYVDRKTQAELEDFLRRAGIRLDDYTPPWLTEKPTKRGVGDTGLGIVK